jgi:CubicO group peptidase (beta-lactamase class C family)
VVEPGSVFAYTGHGFATLGQIVEDVSGMPLERRLRERIFEPLGMADTDLVRSDRIRSHLATGYDFGPGGPEAVTDREWVGRAAGGIYSSSRDMARFVAALLGGGANEHGSVLRPATLATMFQPHHRPDPRLPGMGLGFFLADACGHRFVGHDGLLPGFNADLLVAPDDALGVFGFTNGSSGAFTWLPIELERLLRRQLHLPDDAVRGDIPHHPEIWSELCGRYRLPPRVSDQRGRLAMGGGVQVFVRGGRLMARMLTPVPALYRGIPLHPDDERDPFVFRADLSRFGMPTVRLVFSREPGRGTTAIHTDLQSLSLFRQPAATRGRALAAGAVVGLGFATAATAARRRRGHVQGAST